ncbi:MAG: FAD-dependent oxidoreductase [Planctomycetota bacterium JB042]
MDTRTERLDVLVLGDGPAAVSAALHVKRRAGDAAVALWRSAPVGAGDVPPRPGVALAAPSPDLVAAHATRGDARLAGEIALARAGLDSLEREVRAAGIACGFRRERVARDPVPDEPGRARATEELERRFAPADDAVFDPTALLAGLTDAARAAGVDVRATGGAPALDAADDAVDVAAGRLRARATRVVLAAEAALVRFDPWVRSLALPARIEALALAADDAFAAFPPRSLGPGFAVAAPDASGRLLVAEGIEPSNRGDPLDPAPNERAQARLEEWAASIVPTPRRGAPAKVVARGAHAALYTCDGLPLVGPHPGRAACLLAAGFGGREETDGWLAGAAVAEIVVDGRTSTEGAALWSPRRML